MLLDPTAELPRDSHQSKREELAKLQQREEQNALSLQEHAQLMFLTALSYFWGEAVEPIEVPVKENTQKNFGLDASQVPGVLQVPIIYHNRLGYRRSINN